MMRPKELFNRLYQSIVAFIKESFYLLHYSVRAFITEFFELLAELKQPRMWFYTSLMVFFLAAYYRNLTLMKWAIPAILLMYIVRQKIDGKYRYEMIKRAFLNNDEKVLKDEYGKYERKCYFSHREPWTYEKWKMEEIKKYN